MAACQQSHHQHYSPEEGIQIPLVVRYPEGVTQQVIVYWHQYEKQTDRKDTRDHRHQYRLPQELPGERVAQRPHDLSQPYLLAAFGGADRREVHEIDTGDDEDQRGNAQEDIYDLFIPMPHQIEIRACVEIDVAKGTQG